MYLAFCYNVKPRMMNNILFTKTTNKQKNIENAVIYCIHIPRSRNITHGFSSTSVYQIKYTVVSAYSGAFFLDYNGVVSPTRTMFVHKVHVSP
jgi:hypothetical protein